MGSRGQTFDGLDRNPISTNVSAQAAYFTTTDSTNQYRTTANDLEFQTASLTPNFNFENSAGSTSSSTLNAGILNSSTLNASILNSSTLNASILNQSRNATSPVTLQSLYSPNLATTELVQILFGKNNSSSTNAFYLKYIYDTLEANRRFAIQAFGSAQDSISIYKPNVSASASVGTLIVAGGLQVQNIYSSGSIDCQGSLGCQALSALGITGSSLDVSVGPITSGTITVSGSTVSTANGIATLTRTTVGTIFSASTSPTGTALNTQALFKLQHNSNAITNNIFKMMEITCPNMTTGLSSEISFGIDNSPSSSRNFNLGYTFNTTASLRKCYIRAAGAVNSLDIYQQSTTGTNPSGGTLVVTGDLGAAAIRGTSIGLFETTSSTNAVTLQATASTSAYTLKFPQNLGSTNDYLQLGTSGQLQWSAGTGGGSGGSAAYVSAASYTSASTSYASGSTFLVVAFGTNNYDVNTSIGYNPSPGTYPYFRNNSGGTIYVQVNAVVEYSSSTLTTYRHAQIRTTTSSSVDPIGGTFTTIMQSWNAPSTNTSGVGQTCTLAGIVKLQANECFIIVTRQNTGSNLSATAQIQFSVLGGSGLQSITLTPTSSFLTGAAQTTGLNPTINFGLAQTPTGTGTKLVTNLSPTISTGIFLQDPIAFNSVNIQPATSTTAYSFILPTTPGTAGQILTSTGSSSALAWASVDTVIGDSSTSITSPLLTLDGISTSSTIPNIRIRDYNTATNVPLFIQAPNLATTNSVGLRLGVNTTSLNSARLNYNYIGSGSASNYLDFSFHLQSESLLIYKNSITATTAGAGTLVVKGGLSTNDLAVTTKSVFATSSTSVSANNPTVQINGISTINDVPCLTVTNSSSTAVNATTILGLTPSLPTGYQSLIRFGRDLSNFNSGRIGLYYAGAASTSNYISLGLYGQGDTAKIYTSSVAASNPTTASVVVDGGIGCSSLSTNTFLIGSTDYTPTGGTQTDLTIWWAYNITDPTVTNLQYPNIPYQSGGGSGAIQNQRYYWQQIGKSYTFTLNFYCTFDNTSTQLHLLFLRMDSHTPPTPACNQYSMNLGADAGSTESYLSTVKFGLGLYIPAM